MLHTGERGGQASDPSPEPCFCLGLVCVQLSGMEALRPSSSNPSATPLEARVRSPQQRITCSGLWRQAVHPQFSPAQVSWSRPSGQPSGCDLLCLQERAGACRSERVLEPPWRGIEVCCVSAVPRKGVGHTQAGSEQAGGLWLLFTLQFIPEYFKRFLENLIRIPVWVQKIDILRSFS